MQAAMANTKEYYFGNQSVGSLSKMAFFNVQAELSNTKEYYFGKLSLGSG